MYQNSRLFAIAHEPDCAETCHRRWVVGFGKLHGRIRKARIAGALEKQAGTRNIARLQQGPTTRQESGAVLGSDGETKCPPAGLLIGPRFGFDCLLGDPLGFDFLLSSYSLTLFLNLSRSRGSFSCLALTLGLGFLSASAASR